jgi:hypothetical protein
VSSFLGTPAGLKSVQEEDASNMPSSRDAKSSKGGAKPEKKKEEQLKADNSRNRFVVARLADGLVADEAAHDAAVVLASPGHAGSQHVLLLALCYACQHGSSTGHNPTEWRRCRDR